MSLDFDYSKVDRDKYPDIEGDINPVTNALIWHTMNVGMGQHEGKEDEWVFRVLFFEKALSPSLQRYDENADRFVNRPLTAEEIRDHSGLRTNVTNITRTAFLKNVASHFEREAKQAEARAEREAAKA